jgi:hypothetical protein
MADFKMNINLKCNFLTTCQRFKLQQANYRTEQKYNIMAVLIQTSFILPSLLFVGVPQMWVSSYSNIASQRGVWVPHTHLVLKRQMPLEE